MPERTKKFGFGESLFTTAGIGVTGAIEHAVYTANNTPLNKGIFAALFTVAAIGIYSAVKGVSPEDIAERRRQKQEGKHRPAVKDAIPALLSGAATLTSFAAAYKYGAHIPTDVFSVYGPAADVAAGGLGYASRVRGAQKVTQRN